MDCGNMILDTTIQAIILYFVFQTLNVFAMVKSDSSYDKHQRFIKIAKVSCWVVVGTSTLCHLTYQTLVAIRFSRNLTDPEMAVAIFSRILYLLIFAGMSILWGFLFNFMVKTKI